MSRLKDKANNVCIDNLNFDQILSFELDRFKKEAKKHKKQYRVGQTLIICLMTASSCVAAISTAQSEYIPFLSVLNVFLSSSAIAVNTWLKMQKSHDLWKTETMIYHALADIKREIDFECTTGLWTPEKQMEAFKRMNNAIRIGNLDWKKIQNT